MSQPTDATLSVTGLNELLRSVLEGSPYFRRLQVEGEIAGLTRARSGHLYFTLKDAGSQIPCVMFQAQRRLLDAEPAEGDRVILGGEIRHYVPRGSLQLQAYSLRAMGVGDLYALFVQLKNRLQAEGLFDREHKKPIPAYASALGVVSSPDGAVIHDIYRTVERRFPAMPIVFSPSPVQGEAAVGPLIQALQALDARPDIELIILARGGGSMEDLWCFNNENLVRTVAALHTPVITAVGHETDVTLVDFAADLRAPTPTSAAELATPDAVELSRELIRMEQRAGSGLLSIVDHLEQGVDEGEQRLRRGLLQRLALMEQRCETLSRQAEALDFRSVLRRGFSLTMQNGRLIREPQEARPGEVVQTILHGGRFQSQVLPPTGDE
jgi:exodeoxyribonuclease VII large subunit